MPVFAPFLPLTLWPFEAVADFEIRISNSRLAVSSQHRHKQGLPPQGANATKIAELPFRHAGLDPASRELRGDSGPS
jgi:hypothetical protein